MREFGWIQPVVRSEVILRKVDPTHLLPSCVAGVVRRVQSHGGGSDLVFQEEGQSPKDEGRERRA